MSFDKDKPAVPANPWARADRRREPEIQRPTIAQAYAFLVKVVAEADRRRLSSPTIEAIRVLTAPSEAPRTQ